MQKESHSPTKVLFLDQDDTFFQIGQCIAKVLNQLPPMELFHAADATEALALVENLKPDIVVLDDTMPEECDLFIDGLHGSRPRILLQTQSSTSLTAATLLAEVTRIPRHDSLEGVSQVLMMIANIAEGAIQSDSGTGQVH